MLVGALRRWGRHDGGGPDGGRGGGGGGRQPRRGRGHGARLPDHHGGQARAARPPLLLFHQLRREHVQLLPVRLLRHLLPLEQLRLHVPLRQHAVRRRRRILRVQRPQRLPPGARRLDGSIGGPAQEERGMTLIIHHGTIGVWLAVQSQKNSRYTTTHLDANVVAPAGGGAHVAEPEVKAVALHGVGAGEEEGRHRGQVVAGDQQRRHGVLERGVPEHPSQRRRPLLQPRQRGRRQQRVAGARPAPVDCQHPHPALVPVLAGARPPWRARHGAVAEEELALQQREDLVAELARHGAGVGAGALGEGGSARARSLLLGRDREERSEERRREVRRERRGKGEIEAAAAGREAREHVVAMVR
jgi:hypothetical protein